MEDNQTNEGQPDPPQVPPPPPPVEGNVGNSGSEPPGTPSSGTNSQQPEREPIHVTVNVESPQNNDGAIANQIAGRANRLTVWSIAVNVVLMVATFLLFMLTKKATDAAVKSANAADSTYHEQRYNDSVLLVRDSIKNHNDSVNDAIASFKQDFKDSVNRGRDSARFELERASTQSQIEAFKDQGKRFEIEKRAYLQLSDSIRIDTMKINKPLKASIFIDNLGSYPAKVLSTVAMIYIDKKEMKYSLFENVLHSKADSFSQSIGKYITQKSQLFLNLSDTQPMTKNEYNELVLGTSFVYVTGFVKYKNLLNNTMWVYKFSLQIITQNRNPGSNFLVNENERLP